MHDLICDIRFAMGKLGAYNQSVIKNMKGKETDIKQNVTQIFI